ncbi:MAG: ribokinase [Bacteroidales bacterium]|nr:ribokinase [Bacteroidales bacterium]
MKIVDIGSLNVDYVYRVDDFVKPGETKSSKDRNVYAGGKGLNQSIAVARAGGKIFHAGMIGNDGDILKQALDNAGVDTRYLQKKDVAGGHTFIQVSDAGQNSILLFGGTNQMLTEEYIDSVLSDCEKGDIILLQNETNLVGYTIEKAYELGLRVALNASPMDDSLMNCPLGKVSWLVVNEIEGSTLAGSTEEEEEIVKAVAEKYPDCALVLTLGSRGVRYHDKTQDVRMNAYKIKNVVDTTAAGDTFLGYFLACTAEGMPVRDILLRSTTASAMAIQVKGASDSIPARSEVEKAIEEKRFGEL